MLLAARSGYARPRASGLTKPETPHGVRGVPPCADYCPMCMFTPLPPAKSFWPSVGPPTHRTNSPVLPRGIWSPASGAPPLRPPQRALPSVGPSVVLLNVPPFSAGLHLAVLACLRPGAVPQWLLGGPTTACPPERLPTCLFHQAETAVTGWWSCSLWGPIRGPSHYWLIDFTQIKFG